MKNLKFVLGFVTGAIVVYLALYRPVQDRENERNAALHEAVAVLEESKKNAVPSESYLTTFKRKQRLTQPGNVPDNNDSEPGDTSDGR